MSADIEFSAIIIESPVSKKTLFKSRLKKIGLLTVTGQAMFSLLIVPFLRIRAKKRRAALLEEYQLKNADFADSEIHRVSSVNDDKVKNILIQSQPDIVLVNGTRIISKKILESTNAPFVNMHVGITPWYRGSHGGYWALYNKDPGNFGTTIHLIDKSVDTGAVLKQVFMQPDEGDNFTTYPILQTAIGISALKEVLQLALKDQLTIRSNTEKGKMYFQPTIWQYFRGKKINRL